MTGSKDCTGGNEFTGKLVLPLKANCGAEPAFEEIHGAGGGWRKHLCVICSNDNVSVEKAGAEAFATFNMQVESPAMHMAAANRLLRFFFIGFCF